MKYNLLLKVSNSSFKNLIQIRTGLTVFHNQRVWDGLFALYYLFYFKPIPFGLLFQSIYVRSNIGINAQTGVPP
jgi:hypothetical protein